MSSYRAALSLTCPRLMDRLLARSTDTNELITLQKESENPMQKCLTWWDIMWLAFGSLVGSGIFVITGQKAHDDAGPAIVLSYALSGLSVMLSVFCYAEFGVEIPLAAGFGRSWSSYLASTITNNSDFLRIRVNSLPQGFNLLDPVAVLVLLLGNIMAMSGTKRISLLNWVSSFVSAGVIVFVIVVGFIHARL